MTPNWNPPPKDDQYEDIKSTSKLFLSAIALAFVVYLITLLPGTEQLVPLTPVPFAAIITAIVTLSIVGALLMAASSIASIVQSTIDSPQAVGENAASVAYWLIILTAIGLAHRGLSGIVLPYLEGLYWTYDAAFLLLSIPALVAVAVRLFAAIDPSAELIARSVVGEPDRTGRDQSQTTAQNDASGSKEDTA